MALELSNLEDIINRAQSLWWERFRVAKQLNVAEMFPVTRKEVKTVAMFYQKVYNGGIERVMSLLAPILIRAGYRVVLVTDMPPSPEDYDFPPSVDRVVLSDGPCWGCRDFPDRARRWLECLETYQIDAVIYHGWLAPPLLWDMAVIKSTGAAVIVHCHSVFAACLADGETWVQDSGSIFRQADAICVLSNVDKAYWQRVNPKVFLVQNPYELEEHIPEQTVEPRRRILWVGRFSEEKNPEDVLQIMKQVVDRIPDAELTMLGQLTEAERTHYNGLLRGLGLENNVVFPGYTTEVAPYYKQADVVLATSNYEGYPMVFVESFANHLPIVTYQLPYLTILENTDGGISVPWKDIDAAAEAIVRLLTDEEAWAYHSHAAGEKFRELEAYDYETTWQQILTASISDTAPAYEPTPPETVERFAETVDWITRQLVYISRQKAEAAPAPQIPRRSTPLSKLITALRLVKNRGIVYTVKFALEKLR